jgi:hypothetical protein
VELFDHGWRDGAETVVGDEDGAGASRDFFGFLRDGVFGARGNGCLRFAIQAEDLLFGGMGPSGEVTRFCGRDPIAGAEDAGNVDVFAAEMIEELSASGVVADYSDGEDAGAEVGQVEDSVGCAAGIRFGAAMTNDQDWRFAGNAGNFAGNEFVENKIANHANSLARKDGDNIEKSGEVNIRSCNL